MCQGNTDVPYRGSFHDRWRSPQARWHSLPTVDRTHPTWPHSEQRTSQRSPHPHHPPTPLLQGYPRIDKPGQLGNLDLILFTCFDRFFLAECIRDREYPSSIKPVLGVAIVPSPGAPSHQIAPRRMCVHEKHLPGQWEFASSRLPLAPGRHKKILGMRCDRGNNLPHSPHRDIWRPPKKTPQFRVPPSIR